MTSCRRRRFTQAPSPPQASSSRARPPQGGDSILTVSIQRRAMWCAYLVALACVPALATGNEQTQRLNREFQKAVAQYDAGHLAEAAAQLENLLQAVPQSFDVHELLGLVYSGQSQDALANQHLETAVRLKPNSAAARANLATNLIRLGKLEGAQEQLKRAVALDPRNFDANHNLGELYIRIGRLPEAVPFLKEAQRIDPSSYDNGYDLARTYLLTGRPTEARQMVRGLLQRKETAELHNLLGEIEEKDEKFVAAGNEFEIAAHQDPSESNLFDWGSELLLHRTLDPAVTVFQQATERYPNSPRLAIGLGMALYSRGNYDDSVKSLLRAADLGPSDPRCYFFLSKAYNSSPAQADDVIQRFRHFSELQPTNGHAFYYYAMSLWKGRRAEDPGLDLHQIESLLQKALALDATLAEAHFQLGNLYSDQNKYAEAIPEYVRARELDPSLGDVYYRLGQAYVHVGEKDRAQQQFEIYQRVRAEHMAELDKQRADIRQFVYSAKDGASEKP
jgi:tetratricopeptide (TPR) repeat protein